MRRSAEIGSRNPGRVISMQEKARIVNIDGDVVTVVPLDIEACIGCANAECKKNGNAFRAVTEKNTRLRSELKSVLPHRRGGRSCKLSFRWGIPVLLAVAAYAAVGAFSPAAGEDLRIGASIAALVAGMFLVYFTRRGGDRRFARNRRIALIRESKIRRAAAFFTQPYQWANSLP